MEFFKNPGIPSDIATSSWENENQENYFRNPEKQKQKRNVFLLFVTAQLNYHGVEARTEVMGSDEDVVGAVGPIPKWVLGGY